MKPAFLLPNEDHMALQKGHKESFARFFEEPSRDGLRELLKQHVGETKFMDFKEEWPQHAKLAKQVLGFANTGDACLIMGAKENADGSIEMIGLPKLEDKADITNGLKKYLPAELLQRTDVLDFSLMLPSMRRLSESDFK
jgi:hypothetical protein